MLKKILAVLLAVSSPVTAHEFWIEPIDYTVPAGQSVVAEVRSGEYFQGEVFPYMPERIVTAELIGQTGRALIPGKAGDLPAIKTAAEPGLQIISYQSTPSLITHREFAGFQNFLKEDGLLWVENAHHQRGLPVSGFKEKFTRYAKSLVSVNGVADTDRFIGLPYELVVKSELYGQYTEGEFIIQLLVHGQPASDVQVTVFQKLSGAMQDQKPLKLITDTAGSVRVPGTAGASYLASAVTMIEGEDVPWHSHWTSVTFSSR